MCKIRVVEEILNIFEEYRPEKGKVYQAERSDPIRYNTQFCVVDILDKRIVLRRGEYEIVEG